MTYSGDLLVTLWAAASRLVAQVELDTKRTVQKLNTINPAVNKVTGQDYALRSMAGNRILCAEVEERVQVR